MHYPKSSHRTRSSHQSSAGSQMLRSRGNVEAQLDPTSEPWLYPLEQVQTPPELSRAQKNNESGWCGPQVSVSEHLKKLQLSDDMVDFQKRNCEIFVHEKPNLLENNITRSELFPSSEEHAARFRIQGSAQGLVRSVHDSRLSHLHGRIPADWSARGLEVQYLFTTQTQPLLYAEFASRYLSRLSLSEWLQALAVHAQLSAAQQQQFYIDLVDLFQVLDKEQTGFITLSQFQNFLIDVGMRDAGLERPAQELVVQSVRQLRVQNPTDHLQRIQLLPASQQLLLLNNSSTVQVSTLSDFKFSAFTADPALGSVQFGLSAQIRDPYLFIAGVRGRLSVHHAGTLAPVSLAERSPMQDQSAASSSWLSSSISIGNCLTAMAFSDAHSLLFSSSSNNCDIRCFQVSRKALSTSSDFGFEVTHQGSTIGHSEPITCILPNLNKQPGHMLTSSQDGSVKQWSMARAAPIQTVSHWSQGVVDAVQHNDDVILTRTARKVALSSFDGQKIGELIGSSATSMASIPDSHYVATGDQQGCVKLWDTRMLRCVGSSFTSKAQPVQSQVGQSNGNSLMPRVIAGSNVLTEYVAVGKRSEKLPTVRAQHTPLLQKILTIDHRSQVIWDEKTGLLKHTLEFPCLQTTVHADPQARHAVVGSIEGTVYYVDISSMSIIAQYKQQQQQQQQQQTASTNNSANTTSILCTCQSPMNTSFDYPMPCIARYSQKFLLCGSISPYGVLKQLYHPTQPVQRKHATTLHEQLTGRAGHRLQGLGGCEGLVCGKTKKNGKPVSTVLPTRKPGSPAVLFAEFFAELGVIISVSKCGTVNFLVRKPSSDELTLLKSTTLPHKLTCCAKVPALGWLVLGTSTGMVIYYDYRVKTAVSVINHHQAEITSLCVLGNYPLLFSSDLDGLCCIFTLKPVELPFPIVRWVHVSAQYTPNSGAIAAVQPSALEDDSNNVDNSAKDRLMISSLVSSVGLPTQSIAVAQAACLTSKRCSLTPCLYDATSTTALFDTKPLSTDLVEPVVLSACHVSASAFVQGSAELVLGDMEGNMTCLSLSQFIKSSAILSLPELDKHPVDQRAAVLKRYAVSMGEFLGKVEACRAGAVPLALPGDIVLQQVWRAAEGTILHLAPLQTHEGADKHAGSLKAMIACSADLTVQGWLGDGHSLGMLAPGGSSNWTYTSSGQAANHLKAQTITQTVRKFQKDDKTSDKDMDFYSTLEKMQQDIQNNKRMLSAQEGNK